MTQRKLNSNLKAGLQKFLYSFFSLTFFISTTSTAQSLSTEAPAKRITKFAFTVLTGGIVIIHGQLGDFKDTLNFVLDTGSGGISLDSQTVMNYKLKPTASERTIRGIAGIRRVGFVNNQKLVLPGLIIDSLNFHVNDYSILTEVYGMKIDGIIGYSFFSRYIVKMDYEKYNMEVWTQGSMKYPRGGWLLRTPINNIPLVGSEVEDARELDARFYFDSGAGLALLFSEEFVKDSSILKLGKKIITTQAEGLGGKKQMRVTTIKKIKVGPYRFKKVPAYIFEDEFNATSYPQLCGLIGNEIFRRFNTVFNYKKKEIYLVPNKRFNEPFDYSYTGLGIYMVDGEIIVEDVIKDSPGEKAGFKPGDVIFAIEKDFSKNIQNYKTILQHAGARLRVLVLRNDELQYLTLEVKSILK